MKFDWGEACVWVLIGATVILVMVLAGLVATARLIGS